MASLCSYSASRFGLRCAPPANEIVSSPVSGACDPHRTDLAAREFERMHRLVRAALEAKPPGAYKLMVPGDGDHAAFLQQGNATPLGLDAATQRAVLDRSAKLAERWTKLASLELRELVRSLVQQIQIGEAQILVWLKRSAIVSSVMPDAAPKPTVSVEPFVLSIIAVGYIGWGTWIRTSINGANRRRQTPGCGVRTAAGSLKAVFGLSDVERLVWILTEV
jgi:hypothetical protein